MYTLHLFYFIIIFILRPKVDIEVDAMIESSLAGEASLVVLDILELLIGNTLHIENLQSVLGKNLEVLLHLMLCNQSIEVSRCVFASQRAIVRKFPELILYEETEQCAELCARLLKHCSSSMADVRAWACASLYLLMRQNYEIGQVRDIGQMYLHVHFNIQYIIRVLFD